MKKYILQSLRLTAVLMVLLCLVYPLIVAFAGGFTKGQGGGEKVILNGKVVGYALLGQSFTQPEYFWGRPSATGYNAAGSGGSNKGASNAAYLKEVENRIDTLLKYHPYLQKETIPADMVTASGSGIDPDISVQGAMMQVKRIADYHGLEEKQVADLVKKHTKGPFLGLFGPTTVNVLQLNLALQQIK